MNTDFMLEALSLAREAFDDGEVPVGAVVTIGDNAFFQCYYLKDYSWNLPATITTIGDYAFASCDELRDFHVLTNLTTFSENTFEGCNYFNYEMVYNAG